MLNIKRARQNEIALVCMNRNIKIAGILSDGLVSAICLNILYISDGHQLIHGIQEPLDLLIGWQ